MSPKDAEAFLEEYRKLLKAWVMASTGFSPADEDNLRTSLDDGLPKLSEIKERFPELADRADVLLEARRISNSGGIEGV